MGSASVQRWILFGGLIVGVGLGLVYTWYVAPVEVVDTYPALLRDDYRRDWIRMTVLSYLADGDLERVRWRLRDVSQEDVSREVGALVDEYATAGHPADTMRRLTAVAQALGVHTEAMLVYLSTPTSAVAGDAPPSTPAPFSTLTPTPAQIGGPSPEPTPIPPPPVPTPTTPSPFQLVEKEQVCRDGQAPRIEVVVRDAYGEGVVGVEVWLMWAGGADHAVTGLKPQGGAGYVDFYVQPGEEYSLGTSELGVALVSGLRVEPCPASGGEETTMGSWRIVLERRPSPTVEPAE